MESIQNQNKMGYMPIPSLIIRMSLPMMTSMLVLATYNVVDSIFVSRISQDALTAVSLVFPYQMLTTAVSTGTGIGVNSLVARRLGEQRQQDADKAATHGILLSVLSGLFFLALFALLTPQLVSTFKADASVSGYAVTYLYIVGSPAIFLCVQVMAEKVLQATGNTFQSMIIQLVGAVINLIFDPILIFGLLGFPALGIAGAAIATVGGQMIGMLLGLYFITRRQCLVNISFSGFHFHRATAAEIYKVGVPSIVLQMVGSVMNIGLNRILIAFSSAAVSVLGVYFKLQSFIFMPVFGLNSGAMPIMGYNFGARNPRRVMEALKVGAIYAFCIMLAGFLLFQFGPGFMLGFFDATQEMLAIGVPALRTISFCFPFAALCIMGSSLFQAIGNGKLSLLVSVMRQLLVLLPAAYIFSNVFGLSAVWYAFPLAECAATVFVGVMVCRTYHAHIKPLEGNI